MDSGMTHTNRIVYCLTLQGSNLIAGTARGGIFLSPDSGASWHAVNYGFDSTAVVLCIASNDSAVFAGTFRKGIYRSTNNGLNWQTINNGLMDSVVMAVTVIGNKVFAGTDTRGVFVSTNNGPDWMSCDSGLSDLHVSRFARSGQNIFGGNGAGVILSTNSGVSWSDVSTGLATNYIMALGVSDSFVFAGSFVGGIWRRPLSEVFTSVRLIDDTYPSTFYVQQNYPNPFNPTTTIQYQLPSARRVSLKVYNLLGQVVATLTDKIESAGYKKVSWNASNFASGVYFYRLDAAGVNDPGKKFTSVRKMLLIR